MMLNVPFKVKLYLSVFVHCDFSVAPFVQHTISIKQKALAATKRLFSNFEKQESRLTFTTDWSGAGSTFLGKQAAEAVEAVGKVVLRGEPLAGQLLLAPDANKALLMPGLVPVVHSSGGDGLKRTDQTVCIDCQTSRVETGCDQSVH